MELHPNTLFHNRYRLIKEKGRGSFGEVWLARDEQLDLEVAIKIYIALDERGIEEFRSEYKTAYTLNHPNLLHAYHFDLNGRCPYLVMPYCSGKSTDLIGRADEVEIWKLIRDVAAGLAYLHDKDIIHHDIKPDNILFNDAGVYLISDFGISTKMRSTLRRNSTRQIDSSIGGSLPYMGPELFSEVPSAVKSSDIWAMGAMLFEIVTGELPFLGQGGGMQLHGAETPAINADVSSELKETIAACIARQTWDRPMARQLCEYAKKRSDGSKDPCPWSTDKNNSRRKNQLSKDLGNSDINHHVKKMGKDRNGFVCFCIWFVMVMNLLLVIPLCRLVYSEEFSILTLRLIAICSTMSALAGWMIWRYMRWGFWIYLSAGLLSLLATGECTGIMLLGFCIGVVLFFGILQIRKNGVSAWKLMDYSWNKPHMQKSCRVVAILIVIILIMPNKMAGEARANLENYKDKVKWCEAKIEQGTQATPQALIEAKKILSEILDYENKYRNINNSYDRSELLINPLREKISVAAEEWATAAESQSKVGNTEKALEFYQMSLQLDNNASVRSDFETEAKKMAFIKPIDLEFKAEGDYGEKLYANKIKYLYIRLKYDAWDMQKGHDAELRVRIYENGRLSSGTGSGYGYTFKQTIRIEDTKNGALYLNGWGNENVGSYSPGTVRVEVWSSSKKLISRSITIH